MAEINSLADIIRVHGVDRAEHPALIQDGRTLSWAVFAARSAQVAQGLAADGVGGQDRVAFIDKNSIEHFEVFYGAALLNAVCVDVNWRLAAPEVEYILNDSDAKILVIGPVSSRSSMRFATTSPTTTSSVCCHWRRTSGSCRATA